MSAVRIEKNDIPQRPELTYHQGHEEHQAFSRRDADAQGAAKIQQWMAPVKILELGMRNGEVGTRNAERGTKSILTQRSLRKA